MDRAKPSKTEKGRPRPRKMKAKKAPRKKGVTTDPTKTRKIGRIPAVVPPEVKVEKVAEGFEVDPNRDAAPQFHKRKDDAEYRVDVARCVRRSEVTQGQRSNDGLGGSLDPVIRQMWLLPGGVVVDDDGLNTYDERGVAGALEEFNVTVENVCAAPITVTLTTAEAVKSGNDSSHIDVRRMLLKHDLSPGQKAVTKGLKVKDMGFTELNTTVDAVTKGVWLTLFDMLVAIPDVPPQAMSENYLAAGKLDDQTTGTYTGRKYNTEAEVVKVTVTCSYETQPVPKDRAVRRRDAFAMNFFSALDTPYTASRNTTIDSRGKIAVEGDAEASDLPYDWQKLGYGALALVYKNGGGSSYTYVAALSTDDERQEARVAKVRADGGKAVQSLPKAWRNPTAEREGDTYLMFPGCTSSMYDAAGYDPEGKSGGVFKFYNDEWVLWDFRNGGRPRKTDGEWQGGQIDEYSRSIGILPAKGVVRMVRYGSAVQKTAVRRPGRVSKDVLNDPEDFLKWLIRGIQVLVKIAEIAMLFL